jgi:hypothetical protein
MELSKLKLITDKNQIKKSDFIVILQTSIYHPVAGYQHPNIKEYNGKKYYVALYKGKYQSLLNMSKELSVGKFKDYKIVLVGQHQGQKYAEFLAYKDLQSMINECSVYTYPIKIEVEFDEIAIENHLKTKCSFYSDIHN